MTKGKPLMTTQKIDKNDMDDIGAEILAVFDDPHVVAGSVTVTDDRGGSGCFIMEYQIADRRNADRRKA